MKRTGLALPRATVAWALAVSGLWAQLTPSRTNAPTQTPAPPAPSRPATRLSAAPPDLRGTVDPGAVIFSLTGWKARPGNPGKGDVGQVWRKRYEDSVKPGSIVNPKQKRIDGVDDFFHGSYDSEAYLLILPPGESGKMRLLTDGAVNVTLEPAAGQPGVFTLQGFDGSPVAGLLSVIDPACANKPGSYTCFTLTGTGGGAPKKAPGSKVREGPQAELKDGTYEQPMVKQPHEDYKESLGDIFTGLPGYLEAAMSCYDIVTMDPENFQTTGCTKPLFKLPPGNGFHYEKMTVYGHGVAAVPYGWLYAFRVGARGQSRATIMEKGSDVADAHELGIGVKASASFWGGQASFHYNQTMRDRVQNMNEQDLTYAQADYLKTAYTLVLDKTNVTLDDRFKNGVASLAVTKNYAQFIKDFGTHYSFATTYGARGRIFTSMRKDEVVSMRENGVDISVGAEARFSLMGFGGSVGVDAKIANNHMERMKQVLGENIGRFSCVGGDDCSEGHPTGSSVVPVLLDLRPISDLLGPPFYRDRQTVIELRDGVAKAIASYALSGKAGDDTVGAEFVRILPFDDPATGAPNQLSVTCNGTPAVRNADSPAAPPGRIAACCGPGSPTITALSFAKANRSSPQDPTPPAPVKRDPVDLTRGIFGAKPEAPEKLVPFVQSATLLLGQVDFDKYCKAWGHRAARNSDGTGSGWRCIPGNDPVKMDDVCNRLFPPGPGEVRMLNRSVLWFMPNLTTMPPGGPNDWTCTGGGVDFHAYCKAHGGTAATNEDGAPASWRCYPSNSAIDMNQLCEEQFGPWFRPKLTGTVWSCDAGLPAVRTLTGLPGVYPFPSPTGPATVAPLTSAPDQPVGVVTELQWGEESIDVCKGVYVNVRMRLQKATAEEVLLPKGPEPGR